MLALPLLWLPTCLRRNLLPPAQQRSTGQLREPNCEATITCQSWSPPPHPTPLCFTPLHTCGHLIRVARETATALIHRLAAQLNPLPSGRGVTICQGKRSATSCTARHALGRGPHKPRQTRSRGGKGCPPAGRALLQLLESAAREAALLDCGLEPPPDCATCCQHRA